MGIRQPGQPWPRRLRQPRRSAAERIRRFRQPGPRALPRTLVLV